MWSDQGTRECTYLIIKTLFTAEVAFECYLNFVKTTEEEFVAKSLRSETTDNVCWLVEKKELLDGNEKDIINSFHNDIISGRMERKWWKVAAEPKEVFD